MVAMLVPCFASCGDKNEAFKIGATGPLTGEAASYGISVQNGAALAVKHLNAKDGGLKFEFKILDDKAGAADATTNYATLADWGMQLSLGGVTSGAGEAFAKQADITVWGLCLMIDHIHCLIQCNEMMSMSDFVSRVTSVFVRRYNKCRKRVGPLFDERFGSAPKADLKKLISAIIYVGNNPVERRICTRAEEYRWNFLAYADSNHPFSEKIDFKNISKSLSRSIRIVNSYLKRGLYLDYPVVDNIFSNLNRLEREQLIDYIISKYNVIDYKSILSHFDSYKQMLVSMRSTTGSEYDLREDTDRLSDAVYVNLIREIRKMGIDDLRGVVCLGVDDKIRVAEILQRNTSISKYQIRKFLHL
jgi:REP element-mobilizing transposase RayT